MSKDVFLSKSNIDYCFGILCNELKLYNKNNETKKQIHIILASQMNITYNKYSKQSDKYPSNKFLILLNKKSIKDTIQKIKLLQQKKESTNRSSNIKQPTNDDCFKPNDDVHGLSYAQPIQTNHNPNSFYYDATGNITKGLMDLNNNDNLENSNLEEELNKRSSMYKDMNNVAPMIMNTQQPQFNIQTKRPSQQQQQQQDYGLQDYNQPNYNQQLPNYNQQIPNYMSNEDIIEQLTNIDNETKLKIMNILNSDSNSYNNESSEYKNKGSIKQEIEPLSDFDLNKLIEERENMLKNINSPKSSNNKKSPNNKKTSNNEKTSNNNKSSNNKSSNNKLSNNKLSNNKSNSNKSNNNKSNNNKTDNEEFKKRIDKLDIENMTVEDLILLALDINSKNTKINKNTNEDKQNKKHKKNNKDTTNNKDTRNNKDTKNTETNKDNKNTKTNKDTKNTKINKDDKNNKHNNNNDDKNNIKSSDIIENFDNENNLNNVNNVKKIQNTIIPNIRNRKYVMNVVNFNKFNKLQNENSDDINLKIDNIDLKTDNNDLKTSDLQTDNIDLKTNDLKTNDLKINDLKINNSQSDNIDLETNNTDLKINDYKIINQEFVNNNKKTIQKNVNYNNNKIIYIDSTLFAKPEYYNDYLYILDNTYYVNDIKLLDVKIPIVKPNINNSNNTLTFQIENNIITYKIESKNYSDLELIKCINNIIEDIECIITEKNYIIFKHKEDKLFSLIMNDNSLFKKLGFNRNNYKNKNKYVSDKKFKLNVINTLYLYIPDLFFKKNFAKINLLDYSFVQLENIVNNNINTLSIKYKTNEDFVKEDLFDFNGMPNNITLLI